MNCMLVVGADTRSRTYIVHSASPSPIHVVLQGGWLNMAQGLAPSHHVKPARESLSPPSQFSNPRERKVLHFFSPFFFTFLSRADSRKNVCIRKLMGLEREHTHKASILYISLPLFSLSLLFFKNHDYHPHHHSQINTHCEMHYVTVPFEKHATFSRPS